MASLLVLVSDKDRRGSLGEGSKSGVVVGFELELACFALDLTCQVLEARSHTSVIMHMSGVELVQGKTFEIRYTCY